MKLEKVSVKVLRQGTDYLAVLNGDDHVQGHGGTVDAAIGNAIKLYGAVFGIQLDLQLAPSPQSEAEPTTLPEGEWIPEGPHGGCKFVDGDGATLARIVPSLGNEETYFIDGMGNPYQGYSTLEIAKTAAIRGLRREGK